MDNKIKYKAGLCYLCSVDLTEIRFPLSSGPTNDTCFHLPTLLVVCVAGKSFGRRAASHGGFATKALATYAQKQ